MTNGVRIVNSKQNELSIINYLLLKIAFYEVLAGGGKVGNFSIRQVAHLPFYGSIIWMNQTISDKCNDLASFVRFIAPRPIHFYS